MDSSMRFFNWTFQTRANMIEAIVSGVELPQEKLFLSFCASDPTLITNGPSGLNASIKRIGFVPKKELLEDIVENEYIPHIKSYDPKDPTYVERGLKILMKHVYSEEARKNIDFSIITSLEMSKSHTYLNLLDSQYQIELNATMSFYQPPETAFEVRGHAYMTDGIYQRFVNAQYDMYHTPYMDRWDTRPAIIFKIKEVFDNGSNTDTGFGTQLEFPPQDGSLCSL